MSECVDKDTITIPTKSEKRRRKKKERLKLEENVASPEFLLVRLVALFGMTVCLVLFVIQIGTAFRSYRLLQELTDRKVPHYLHMIGLNGETEHWTWDAENEMLLVNTSLYVH